MLLKWFPLDRIHMDRLRPERANSTDRLLILGLILFGWALVVVLRLCDLQLFGHSQYAKLALSQQDRLEATDALRGSILDRNGSFLAISSSSKFAVVNPRRHSGQGDGSGTAGQYSRYRSRQAAGGFGSRRRFAAPSRLLRCGSACFRTRRPKRLTAMKLDWLEIRNGSLRSYPNGQLASHVIGQCGRRGPWRGRRGTEAR